MSFFSRKKDKENEREGSFFAPDDANMGQTISFGENRNQNPDVLTPDEILHKTGNESASTVPSGALEELKKRMREAREKTASKFTLDSTETTKQETFQAAKQAIEEAVAKAEQQAEEQITKVNLPVEPSDTVKVKEEENSEKAREEAPHSLLERCRIYTVDENGNDSALEDGPAYQLESVADILKAQSQTTMDRLTEKYNISFDSLGNISDAGMTLDPVLTVEEEPEEEIPTAKPDEKHSVISDLDDMPHTAANEEEPTATIRFTPVAGEGHSSKISVSSITKAVDLTGELAEFSAETSEETDGELQLERTEFDEYTPEAEYHKKEDGKAIRKLLAIRRRNSFLKMASSLLLTVIPTVFCLPFLSGAVLGNMRLYTIISLIVVGGMALMQWDMFTCLPKMFTRNATADAAAITATLAVLLYAVIGILSDENVLPLLLMLSITLSIRSVGRFFRDSVLFSNFRQIAAKAPKRAVKLIKDPAVTFAMAKNSIDGDVLIAAPQRTEHVDDYMKYSTFRVFLGGKMPVITIVFAALSLVLGFASASYFKGAIHGFYSAAAVQCLCAAPILFLMEDLPLYSAAGKLNRVGSMIAGKAGAEYIAEANAIVLTSEDIFPAGTVSLYRMQVLSENSVDDTLIRAASLTDALRSPLASVFKKIVGTSGNTVLPEADTVKYEDKMGISGWVDDRLLFIGNRTLMEAHGIKVPDIETDRKLLRDGYFPVYVSDADRACALLAIKYQVEETVARELRKLSALGVTMLIQSSDPNMTEEMICDYMGLYEDSVKVMSSAGCHMYKNAAAHAESVSAPAAYKGNPIGLSAIVNAANRIHKSHLKLTVLYLLTAILGAILFTYLSFDGKGSPLSGGMVLLYELICTAISTLIYLFEKP